MKILPKPTESQDAPSPFAIRPLGEPQLPQVSRLLSNVFGPGMLPAFVDSLFLQWKFFEPFPEWDTHRSYIIEQDDDIVAHACLWPSVFQCASAEVRCSHILDWAARPSAKGSGVTIYRHLMGLTEASFVVGGSDQAQRLLPRLGFKLQGTQRLYARVVRPWAQFRSRQISSPLREVGRLLRNAVWSLGAKSPPAEWSAQPASTAGEELDRLTCRWRPQSYCSGKRSAALVNYLLRCPIAKADFYVIYRAGVSAGYFILNRVGGQCRIVDVFIGSEDREAWRSAYALIVQTAAAIEGVCEVAATASLPWLGEVLQSVGFRLRQEKPIFLYDPEKRFAGLPPLLIQMVDSDAFFLHDPSYPYLT
jgi:hypothetical protein